MRHYLNWKQYTAQPSIKILLEQKGMEFVKKQYQREVNRVQWTDPNIGAI